MPHATFTVRDLLDGCELDLRLVAGAEGDHVTVAGIHCIEIEQAGDWLEHGWVMMTTGLSIAADPEAQRDLVRSLKAVGCAALGYGTGVVSDDVPPALVRAAEEHGLALFEVPGHVPFRAVTSYVWKQVHAMSGPVVQRLASIERILLAAVTEKDGVSALITRMSKVLGCDVALMRHGLVEASTTGVLPIDDILAAIGEVACGRFETGGWHGRTFDVGGPQESCHLVLAVRSYVELPDLLEAVGSSCVSLVRMAARLGQVAASQRSAAVQAALHALLDAADRAEAAVALCQLQDLGFTADSYSVVIAESDDCDRSVALVNETPGRPVAVVRDVGVVVLLPGHLSAKQIAERLRTWHLHPDAAVGRLVSAPEHVSRSLADALVVRRASKAGSGVNRYEALTLPDLLLAELPTERFGDRVSAWLQPVEEHPLLLETALVYLDAGYNVTKAATVLGVHPNSVRYRLRRVEELLDSDLRSPAVLLALFVAAKAISRKSPEAAILTMSPRQPVEMPGERRAAG